MLRIDSNNARPDVNGTGKKGFHNNVDLPGVDATYLTPNWLNSIQEELCNLLEKRGITLNPNSRQQLYDLLAGQDDLEALADAVEQKLDDERDARAAAIATVATRVEDLSVFKHVRSLYRDMSLASTPRPPGAADNYTVGSVSAQLFPDNYVRQTIRLITSARDTWLPVYLPISCDIILSVSGMVQSSGSGTGDDDIALRIKSFFGQGQESFMNYRSTYIELRVDRVSDDQTVPYDGDVTVYLEVATLTYLKPTSLNNYPVISP